MDVSRISEELLETVRRYRGEPDTHGMPAMKYHDQMLGCQRKLEEAFSQVKHFMAQQQQQLDRHHDMKARNGKGEGYGDDEHWSMDKDQNFNGPDQKKIRRGVSYFHNLSRDSLLTETAESRTTGTLPQLQPCRDTRMETRTGRS